MLQDNIRCQAVQALLGLALALPAWAQAGDLQDRQDWQAWQLTALPGLEIGTDINNRGLVAGQTQLRATSWYNGLATPLAEPPGGAAFPSMAMAVSPLGVMAGNGGNSRGANWTSGGLTSLGVLREGVATFATGVNDSGTAVGSTHYANGASQATQWNLAGQPTLLAGLSGSQTSTALAINAAGQVVGLDTRNADAFDAGFYRAVIWNQGQISPLYTPGWEYSIANDINQRGEVAGRASIPNQAERAVVWNADGSMRTLPLPAGGLRSSAFRLNDAGWVVGSTDFNAGDGIFTELMLWDEEDNTISLSQILAGLNTAAGTHWGHWSGGSLNDLGQIVINGYDDVTNQRQAFVLSLASGSTGQVPEPHSLALALCGLALLWRSTRGRNPCVRLSAAHAATGHGRRPLARA